MIKILFAAAAVASLSACASSTYSLTAAPSVGATARYEQGRPIVVSQSAYGAIIVMPVSNDFTDRLVLAVVAVNRAQMPVNFGYENIHATYDDGAPATALTAPMLRREARSKAAMAHFSNILNGALMAAEADVANGRSASWTTTSSSGHTRTTNYRGYDHYGAYRMRQEAAHQTRLAGWSIEADKHASLNTINTYILQTTTVDPGLVEGGLVFFERPNLSAGSRVLNLTVSFHGEAHHVRLVVSDDRAAPPYLGEVPAITRAALPYGGGQSYSTANIIH